jgi:hypothetical protein
MLILNNKADDVRINKEVVEAEKLLKEYLYMKEFPNFIIHSATKLSEDLKYVYEKTIENKADMLNMMAKFKEENDNYNHKFSSEVDTKIETLHQEILNLKEEQDRFTEDTENKIELVEKNTLAKIKDYEELLKTRPNKEFVRDTTQME